MNRSPVHELLYISRAVIDLDPEQLEAFLGPSRERNAQAGITGMLLHIQDENTGQVFYLQLLEGPDPGLVEQTYERISRDELHTDLRVLQRGERAEPTFGEWSMLAGATSAEAVLRQLAENVDVDEASPEAVWDLLQDRLIARSLLMVAAAEQPS